MFFLISKVKLEQKNSSKKSSRQSTAIVVKNTKKHSFELINNEYELTHQEIKK